MRIFPVKKQKKVFNLAEKTEIMELMKKLYTFNEPKNVNKKINCEREPRTESDSKMVDVSPDS